MERVQAEVQALAARAEEPTFDNTLAALERCSYSLDALTE
jgi:hypothetical protein